MTFRRTPLSHEIILNRLSYPSLVDDQITEHKNENAYKMNEQESDKKKKKKVRNIPLEDVLTH